MGGIDYGKKYLDLGSLIHEILHRLFNIDNAIDLDGRNLSRIAIPTSIREGSVQYLTQLIYETIEEGQIENFERKMIPPNIYSNLCECFEIYQDHLNFVKNYLEILSSALSNDSHKDQDEVKDKITEYLELISPSAPDTKISRLDQSKAVIKELFLSFFIQSDDAFLKLPSKFGLLDENGQPIKDFLDLKIERFEYDPR